MKADKDRSRAIDEMRDAVDTFENRLLYSYRMGTVEPVFGNIRISKRLDRFSYRGQNKVNGQWLLFCIVHNIEKLSKYSPKGAFNHHFWHFFGIFVYLNRFWMKQPIRRTKISRTALLPA